MLSRVPFGQLENCVYADGQGSKWQEEIVTKALKNIIVLWTLAFSSKEMQSAMVFFFFGLFAKA